MFEQRQNNIDRIARGLTVEQLKDKVRKKTCSANGLSNDNNNYCLLIEYVRFLDVDDLREDFCTFQCHSKIHQKNNLSKIYSALSEASSLQLYNQTSSLPQLINFASLMHKTVDMHNVLKIGRVLIAYPQTPSNGHKEKSLQYIKHGYIF